jgi:hypothetical protein
MLYKTKSKRLGAAGLALCTALGTGVIVAPTANAAPTSTATAGRVLQAANIPVTGTTSTGTFTGSLSNLSTSVVNGVLTLTGTITGTATNTATGVTTPVNDTFTATINNLTAGGSCKILDLDLGPLSLDLLGLQIDLSQVQLDITAVRGAGNLLGNLLCAVAGLLDRGGPLTNVSQLLNRLLAGLG